ncbi:MAG: FKBP12-associated protein [Chrysothrix sp. TS-e1954]|nr:MAG: FKBP12-associated protein [Chrysothrix sp. TS-e1954]
MSQAQDVTASFNPSSFLSIDNSFHIFISPCIHLSDIYATWPTELPTSAPSLTLVDPFTTLVYHPAIRSSSQMSTTAPTPVAHEQIYGQDSAVRQPTHRRARGPRQRYDGARQRATANLVDSAEPTQSRPSALAMRPASVAPSRTATPRARNPANNSRSAAEKGARQGPAPGRLHEERTVGRRQFGGRLTTNNDHTLPSSFQLDAPEFVPGARASKTSHRPPDKPADTRSESKSTAPDIATRIHQDIDHGHGRQIMMPFWQPMRTWEARPKRCGNGDALDATLLRMSNPRPTRVGVGKNTVLALSPDFRLTHVVTHVGNQDPYRNALILANFSAMRKSSTRKCLDTDYDILQPPLPCGTKNPPCRYDCERSKLCGHPQVPHNCHPDDDSCPRCPYFTTKPCLCGRKTLQNQQCWFAEVRCGEVCGRKLKCGAHACRKTCHKPGECDDAASKCQQACGKPRSSCAHPCEDTCHAPYPCKEEKQCTHKILITCECQHHKQETRCSASKSSEGNATKSLKCDDECARLERNRRLAAALDIDPSTHTDDHVPYSTETLTIYASHTKWATEQEREIRVFVADSLQKRIRFKPMHKSQRDFLHNLAEDFGLDHESIDPEPHRHVAVFKTPRFVAAPTKTLRDCARIRGRQQVVADKEAAETARAKAEAARPDPWNGFVLGEPRFALTSEEVDEVVRPVLGSSSSSSAKLGVEVTFIQTGEVVLLARSLDTNASSLESQLKSLKPPLFRALTSQTNICKSMHLCAFNPITQRTTRRETDGVANGINGASNGSSGAGGGWSQVAARGAAARTLPPQMGLGVKSAFTVLGNGNGSAAVKSAKSARSKEKSGRVADREKERERESVAEDWEEEAAKEFAGGASSMVEQQIEQGEVEKEAEIEAGTKTKAEVEKEKEKEKEVEVEVEVGGDLAESTAGENHVVDTEEGGEVVT